MKQYQYKVKTREGQQIQGIVEADDKNAAIGKLRSQKYYVTSLREKKAQKSSFSFLQPRGKVKAKHLAILCRQFAIQLETGLSLVNSLQLLEEQSSDPRVKQAFQQIRLDVASGSSFTKSLDKHSELFPHVFLRLIEAGEIAGALPAVLDRLAIYYEREDELRKKISEALMYPAVISVFAVVMVAALLFFVLPMFADIFAGFGADLPIFTQVVLRFRELLIEFWFLWLAGALSVGITLRLYIKTKPGRFQYDRLMLNIPILGNMVKMVIFSRFSRTLGLLLNSGISMIQSLDILERLIENAVVSSALGEARLGVERGQGLTAPLKDKKVFPTMLIQMVAVGEETGNLERTLVQLSDFYDRETNYAVASFTKILEPVVMLFLAVIVLFIAISVLLPMMGMINQF